MAYRYTPSAYGALRRMYMRNPAAFSRGARAVARAAGGAVAARAATGAISRRSADRDIAAQTIAQLGSRRSQGVSAGTDPSMYNTRGTQANAVARRVRSGIGSGNYKGRFLKNKKRAIVKSSVDFSKFGVSEKTEEFGEVDDNDTVYLITPCANDNRVILCLLNSIVKKLLMMGLKWTPTSWTDEIYYGPGVSDINAAGLFINLYGGRPDLGGSDNSYDMIHTYPFVNGDTIVSVATQFLTQFLDYSQGDLSGNPNTEIYSMVLGQSLRNASDTGTQFTVLSVLYLDNEVAHWKGFSRLKIQNRTNSVTSSASTDVNDAKPLEGYIYEFSGLPRLRVNSTGDFKQMSVSRCTKTFGAATVPNDFKEPPPAKIFTNCKKKTRIHLNPGEIKEVTVGGSGSMALKTFLKKLNAQESLDLTIHTMFKTQMIALEELINSTDVNAVKIGFENAVSLSVTCTTKKKKMVTNPFYRVVNITETP